MAPRGIGQPAGLALARSGRGLRLAFFVLVVVVFQLGFLELLGSGGVVPEVLVVVPILAGAGLGPEAGAVSGFAVGLAYDALGDLALGLNAILFCLTGYLAGRLHGAKPSGPLVASIAATSAFVVALLELAFLALVGRSQGMVGSCVGSGLASVVACLLFGLPARQLFAKLVGFEVTSPAKAAR
jgi:rod shape-determining protein MreD